MLNEHKKAIGWTIANIKEISSSIYKIFLEDDHKAIIKRQKRLNLIMKEVVKKKIIKWLDVGIIYPILDSSWVCLIQCIPKKGGMIRWRHSHKDSDWMESMHGLLEAQQSHKERSFFSTIY